MRAGLSWLRILGDLFHFLYLGLRSRTSLAAENLFLRKLWVPVRSIFADHRNTCRCHSIGARFKQLLARRDPREHLLKFGRAVLKRRFQICQFFVERMLGRVL